MIISKLIKTTCAVVLCFSLSACGEVVETGERGVESRFGEIKSESLPEGLYFYNPFTTKIRTLDVKTQVVSNNTTAYTKDIQQASIKYTINYRLKDTEAHSTLRDVGMNWQSKLVPQVIEGSIKETIGQWEAVELIANRQQAAKQIIEKISTGLAPRNVIVENFELNNIDYSGKFEQAVEAKVTAIQKAAEAKNKTIQVEEEAKQKVISAEAEATSMKIRSEALSQNKSLVEYEAVQKWDGKLPNIMMSGGSNGAVPFINMNNLTGSK